MKTFTVFKLEASGPYRSPKKSPSASNPASYADSGGKYCVARLICFKVTDSKQAEVFPILPLIYII